MAEISSKELYKGRRRYGGLVRAILAVLALILVLGLVMFYYFQRFIVVGRAEGLRLEIPFLDEFNGKSEEAQDGGDTGEEDGGELIGDVEIVYMTPDYTQEETLAGDGVYELRAVYVPISSVKVDSMERIVSYARQNRADAVVLEMKSDQGKLAYKSSIEETETYGVNGSASLAELIYELKSREIYLVAQISCATDNLMAQRNQEVTLEGEDGTPYIDSEGRYWLDLQSAMVRTYIYDLCRELASMGFDEIVLKNFMHPDTEEALSRQETSAPITVTDTVSGAAMRLAQRVETLDKTDVLSLGLDDTFLSDADTDTDTDTDTDIDEPEATDADADDDLEADDVTGDEDGMSGDDGAGDGNDLGYDDTDSSDYSDDIGLGGLDIYDESGDDGIDFQDFTDGEDREMPSAGDRVLLSTYTDSATLALGANKNTGQDVEILFRFFDRVYCHTGNPNDDSILATNYITTGSNTSRFVPIIIEERQTGSYLMIS